MKKIFIIFVLLFMCCGCSDIRYNLKIDKKIEEYITFKDEHFHALDDGSIDSMPDMSEVEYMFQSLPYNSGGDSDGNYYAGTFYDNISDIHDSIIFKYINEYCIQIGGNNVKIDITSADISFTNNINNLEISLYIPYYVSKHNADKVSNNTYTWIIDDMENDSVKINFDLSKPADFIQKIISYSVIGVIVIAIICVIIYFVNKNKKANEI